MRGPPSARLMFGDTVREAQLYSSGVKTASLPLTYFFPLYIGVPQTLALSSTAAPHPIPTSRDHRYSGLFYSGVTANVF